MQDAVKLNVLPDSKTMRFTQLPLLMNLLISLDLILLGNEIWCNEIALLEHSSTETTSWFKTLIVICAAILFLCMSTAGVMEAPDGGIWLPVVRKVLKTSQDMEASVTAGK